MGSVQVDLPSELVERLRQEVSSDAAFNQVVAAALQMWLAQRHTEKRKQAQGLHVLRQAGLAMHGARQRALADAIMPPLRAEDVPSRAQVEAALARLQVPLSEDILAMRDQR